MAITETPLERSGDQAGGIGFDNPTLTNVRERAATVSNAMTPQQKMTTVGGGIAVAILVLAWSFFGNNTDWAPLMTDLSADDANAVVQTLDSNGVDYQLEAGGSTIMVPSDQVYATRLMVAETDLPDSGQVGYGILDNQGVGSSEFTQQVGYQRALEGEFAATIQSIEGVKAATVHLVLPKDDTFALASEEASGSVLVTTDGDGLSTNQTRAIVNLVASGVEDLDPADVTVADSEGNVLAAPGTGITATADGRGTEELENYETNVASAIESMLVAVVGPGKVRATVAADVNFDMASTVSETYDAPAAGVDGEPLATSEATKNETYAGQDTAPEGVVGPFGEQTGDGAGATDYSLEERQVNNALNKVTETTEKAPGEVERISVAVVLDEGAIAPDQIGEIEQMVAGAAGIQAERGDTVSVSVLPFDQSIADAQARALEVAEQNVTESAGLNPLVIGGAVLALLAVIGAVVMMKKKKKDEPDIVLSLPPGSDPIAGSVDAAGNAIGAASGDRALVGAGVGELGMASTERREALGQLIDNQPDEVAELLRSWLGDRREGAR